MALTPWLVSRDPFFDDPFSILDNFSTNFDSSLTPQQRCGSEGARRVSAFARAPVDVREKDNQYIFEADLPGLTKDEVKVQLEEDGKVLAISGERKHNFEEKKKEGQNFHRWVSLRTDKCLCSKLCDAAVRCSAKILTWSVGGVAGIN
jgi:HSP20 family molecular chaperone IbpA